MDRGYSTKLMMGYGCSNVHIKREDIRMRKPILFIALITATFLVQQVQNIHAESHPVPNVKQDCQDKEWYADGYWGMLKDGQYGAESTQRRGGKHKWKVCVRRGVKIHAIWCKKLPVEATTELLNEEFSTSNGKFVQKKISDSGTYKATGFWIFE